MMATAYAMGEKRSRFFGLVTSQYYMDVHGHNFWRYGILYIDVWLPFKVNGFRVGWDGYLISWKVTTK
jgi:hypothetical protein